MPIQINYRFLNEKGLAELESIKRGAGKGSHIEPINVKSNPNSAYLKERFNDHFSSWVKGFPALIHDVGALIKDRTAESQERVKRQSWNTFIAKPAELAATLVSPMIDDVAYKTFCLKVDYDFYLSENEIAALKTVKTDGSSIVVPEKAIENPAVNLKNIWKVLQEDLKTNSDIKEIKIEGESKVSIPRDIALESESLSLGDFIIATSSDKNLAKKELKKLSDDDFDKIIDALYANPPIFQKDLKSLLDLISLADKLKIATLKKKCLEEEKNVDFSQSFTDLIKNAEDITPYILKVREMDLQIPDLTISSVSITEKQLAELSYLPGLKKLSCTHCQIENNGGRFKAAHPNIKLFVS